MSIQLVNANSLKIPLADKSVHMAVTSPPYWSLRDYQVGGQLGLEKIPDCLGWATGKPCGECYVCKTLEWTREVKRVLRDDGTFWLNLGDSYASSWGSCRPNKIGNPSRTERADKSGGGILKEKDLVGIPWSVAFALRADGWYLRSDIIWSKPNPMPESVTDRPTKAHEYLFLLSKSPRYFYDAEAVREKGVCDDPREVQSGLVRGRMFDYDSKEKILRPPRKNDGLDTGGNGSKIKDHVGNSLTRPDKTRNRRSVWHIATAPYSGAHFATYPPALVEPCIKAGTSERGACPKCGKQWVRVVEKNGGTTGKSWHNHSDDIGKGMSQYSGLSGGVGNAKDVNGNPYSVTTLGFRPDCECGLEPVPCVVLDPFAGSGTTLLVARKLGRSAIGFDLSMEYLTNCARSRLSLDALDEWENGATPEHAVLDDLPLFSKG